jgi:hypothetical protein
LFFEGLTAYCDEFLIKEELNSILNLNNKMTSSIYVNPNDVSVSETPKDEQQDTDPSQANSEMTNSQTYEKKYIHTNPMVCATFSGSYIFET